MDWEQLIALARMLASAPEHGERRGRPQQMQLRKAVSAAYLCDVPRPGCQQRGYADWRVAAISADCRLGRKHTGHWPMGLQKAVCKAI